MRKQMSVFMVIVLSIGLVGAALVTAAQAATVEQTTKFEVFRYRNGRFTGKVSAEKALCLDSRKVTILRVRRGTKPRVVATPSLVPDASKPTIARFSAPKPERLVHGKYFAKLGQTPVSGYGFSWLCLGSRSLTIRRA